MLYSEIAPERETELVDALVRRLAALLPGLQVKDIQREPRRRDGPVGDLRVRIRKGRLTKQIVIEAKIIGEPRFARQAIEELRAARSGRGDVYPVFASRYVTESARRLCREASVGYVDLLGNVYLEFDTVYIDRQVSGSGALERRAAKQILAPKATRVLRALLFSPRTPARISDLAEQCSMTPAGVYRVVRLLEDKGFVERDREKRVVLGKPKELLDAWAAGWDFRRSQRSGFFALESDPGRLIEKVAAFARPRKLRYALTLQAGASRVAPFVRFQDVWLYVSGDPKPWVDGLDLRPVDSGANLTLLEPYDEGVFMGLQDLKGVKVVSNLQLYVDLYNYPARGREQADFLRERKIGF